VLPLSVYFSKLNFFLFFSTLKPQGVFLFVRQKESKNRFSIGWKFQFRACMGMPSMQQSRWDYAWQGKDVT
jgi:hypothetical protein